MSNQPTTNPTAPAPSCSLQGGAGDSFQHTPGPWHIASVVFGRPIGPHEALAVWDETHGQKEDSILGRPVCVLTPLESLNPMDEANAHLIAAAPDLLAALERIAGTCGRYLQERPIAESDFLNPDYVPPLTQAQAAIAKAKGQQ